MKCKQFKTKITLFNIPYVLKNLNLNLNLKESSGLPLQRKSCLKGDTIRMLKKKEKISCYHFFRQPITSDCDWVITWHIGNREILAGLSVLSFSGQKQRQKVPFCVSRPAGHLCSTCAVSGQSHFLVLLLNRAQEVNTLCFKYKETIIYTNYTIKAVTA